MVTVAKMFTCGATRLKHLSVFGLSPYYENKLLKSLDEVPFYSVSFDESFNWVTKNEQMDFGVRFWDNNSHYLTSKFIGHARVDDFWNSFNNATSKLEPQKILQISMDGPNVNKKFLRDLIFQRESSNSDLCRVLSKSLFNRLVGA